MKCDLSFIRDNEIVNGVLRVVHFKIHFLIRFSSDHNEIPMANANIKIVNEYDQEIPQSQTADNPVAPRGRAAQPSRDTRKTN